MSGEPVPRRPLATVGALVVGPTGRVLLIRTHKWRERWGVPGGKIEYGETMAAAVRRELREETGLELADIHWAPVQEAVESLEFHRPAHFLLLNFVARSGSEQVRLNDEAQTFAWVDPKEALEMDLNRPTMVLVRHFLERGFDTPPLEPDA
jgi:ADP-ribose pyrophosphatase YjhB (NUDIX family)